MAQIITAEKTKLSESEATFALREGWKLVFGDFPSDDSLAILWAQSALETGRWSSIWNYNFGNIKKTTDHDYCMYRCSEIIGGKNIYFDPPHPQTHFNAYPSAVEGAKEYIQFVSQRVRYQAAWQELVLGNPIGYCAALKKAGYFTADLVAYTKGVVSLTNEFKTKKANLLAWQPPAPPVSVEPVQPVVEEVPPVTDSVPVVPQAPTSTELVPAIPEVPKLNWLQVLWQFLCQIFKLK
jgi:hypothetical protein